MASQRLTHLPEPHTESFAAVPAQLVGRPQHVPSARLTLHCGEPVTSELQKRSVAHWMLLPSHFAADVFGHSAEPACTLTPSCAATDSFQYVTLSQPHTGDSVAVSAGRVVHTPEVAVQVARLQYSVAAQPSPEVQALPVPASRAPLVPPLVPPLVVVPLVPPLVPPLVAVPLVPPLVAVPLVPPLVVAVPLVPDESVGVPKTSVLVAPPQARARPPTLPSKARIKEARFKVASRGESDYKSYLAARAAQSNGPLTTMARTSNSTPRLRARALPRPLHVVLVEPEIPPNTGNVARLCAAAAAPLHLVGPLGFRIDEHSVRRAGVDYWHLVDVRRHLDFAHFVHAFEKEADPETAVPYPPGRLHLFSGVAAKSYLEADFAPGDALVFGKESVGLPDELLAQYKDRVVGIPTIGAVRSLNLANAAGIAIWEALRQSGALASTFTG
jgi:tRNA (cytidine/uridine-2'-O-)-methyltransferase